MLISAKTRRHLRINSTLFAAFLIGIAGMLGWLSTRYSITADWTSTGRHTLSEASAALLKRLDKPVEITAYARPEPALRELIEDLVDRYRRIKPNISLRFVNPDTAPDELRELGIRVDGELVVRYAGRSEQVQEHSEEELSNALQRLLRTEERWIVFLQGHGERDPQGDANHDLSQWAQRLTSRGLKVQGLNLGAHAALPDNTSVLVIASPEVALLPGETDLLLRYLDRGGNLLWLAEPGSLQGLEGLAEALGLVMERGTIVDPATALFGIDHPAMAPVTNYGPEVPVAGSRYITVFPYARAIKQKPKGSWRGVPILSVGSQTWAETGQLEGEIAYDQGKDLQGPLDIGVRLTRERPVQNKSTGDAGKKAGADKAGEQRVIVLGDGDFLSNSYLGNSGNLDLGLRIINWLATDDILVEVPAHRSVDTKLDLTDTETAIIGFGFLFVIPALLGGVGFYVWLRRRRA
ncbi:MAG: GldG family protein [Gammaproteobacteria bacterium]